jgi:transposase
MLTACKLVQSKLYDIEMSLRGILRGFGIKVGPTTASSFAAQIKDLVALPPALQAIACSDARVRLLMSAPGVGAIVTTIYIFAIDDPGRFTSSKRIDAISA